MSDRLTVAVLGTGTMGSGMAANLAKAGFDVRVWNRTTDRAEPLGGQGCTVYDDAADAVTGADVVITMLWDVDSVADAIRSVAAQVKSDAVWVQTTTVGVAGERQLADLAADSGLRYVDAPVLGSKVPAANGTLTVLAAGPEQVRSGLAPVFDAIANRTIWLDLPGGGSRLKLVANQWVLTMVDGIAEALTLARALGVPPELFLDAVKGGAMDAPYVQQKGRGMLSGDFEPAFTLSGALKDAELIRDAMLERGMPVDLISVQLEHFRQAVRDNDGSLDMSAVYLAHQPGVRPEPG